MVLNNYRAIQFIRENRNVDLSPEMLIEVQGLLTDKTLDDQGEVGRIRTLADGDVKVYDDRDSEVLHIPPPANELPERLKKLCTFANKVADNKDFIHPVIAACILHFQIGYDHPFCDGNGRTARAAFYWMMLRRGYWLFEYLPISRLIYKSAADYARSYLFCETDELDITYFLIYHANIIRLARLDLQKYINDQYEKMAEARKILQTDDRLNHRQQELVMRASKYPDRLYTIHSHQAKHGIVYATARSDLLQLEEWGYLRKIVQGKRYAFDAGEKLRSLSS